LHFSHNPNEYDQHKYKANKYIFLQIGLLRFLDRLYIQDTCKEFNKLNKLHRNYVEFNTDF